MNEKRHSRLALIITLLIMLCMLIAAGIFVLFRMRERPEEAEKFFGEDPAAWLGTETVLDILARDSAEGTSPHAPLPSLAEGPAPSSAADSTSGPVPVSEGSAETDLRSGESSGTEQHSGESTGTEQPPEGAPGAESPASDPDAVSASEPGSAPAQVPADDTPVAARPAGETARDLGRKTLPAKENDPRGIFTAAIERTKKEAASLSRKSLTKTQKKNVQSWEDFYGRTFPLDAPLHDYNWKHLSYDKNGVLQYKGDENYTVRRGIDVSEFQGSIDWEAVRKAGYDFVFIRAGYRMFNSGDLFQDSRAVKNLTRAKKAGLDVGVYVFSQAISKKEAREEADLCLRVIEKSGVDITLPIVFDPEIQIEYVARINYITPKEFTDNAVAFCERIEEAGYVPAIYSNSSTMTDIFDMSRLNDAVIWYADYNATPESPYHFTFWQYTDYGWVDGIPETQTDLNLWFVKTEDTAEETSPADPEKDKEPG